MSRILAIRAADSVLSTAHGEPGEEMTISGTARALSALLVSLRIVALLASLVVIVPLLRGEPLAVTQLLEMPRSVSGIITTSTTTGTGTVTSTTDEAGPVGRPQLRRRLQGLLAHHTSLAVRFMRSTVSEDPGFVDAANAVLVRNAGDLETALAGVADGDDAARFTQDWSDQTQMLFAYATALRDGDDTARESAREQLKASVDEQATVIAELTDGLFAHDMAATSLQMRIDLLLYQIDAYARADYDQAYELSREVYAHAFPFASALAAGATGHQPGDGSAREELNADLARILGEHAELSIDALRAGVTGSDEFTAAAAALDANSKDFADVLDGLFGSERAQKVTRGWATHVDLSVRYAVAVAEHDNAERRQIRDHMRKTSGRTGRALAKTARGVLHGPTVADALRSHDVLVLDQIEAYAHGDHAASHDIAYAAHGQMRSLARMLAKAFMQVARTSMPQGGAETGGGGTAGG